MTREEFIEKYPWIDPTLGYPKQELIKGVTETDRHVLVRTGAAHKAVPFLGIDNSKDIKKVDGHNWELFRVSKEGTVNGVPYVWGMFVEGIGAFDVMAPFEFTRDLDAEEREAWSKKTLIMVGSHSGKLSYTLPSGVKA